MEADKVRNLIEKVYAAFNRRYTDEIFSHMDPEVHWPNGWEGGYVEGYSGVRDYWTRQWVEINPKVFPLGIHQMADGRVQVEVHQIVKDLEGNLLLDAKIKHVYTLENGLIKTMEIVDY
jgi:hypothetical protein